MDISKISTSVLKNVLSLSERREALLSELNKVESSISAILGGKAVSDPTVSTRRGRRPKTTSLASPVKRGGKTRSSGRRGALKDGILAALRDAGDKGVSVKELSEKLGVKNQNVHVWFSSTGRKLGTIQKVGAGRYKLKA